MIDELVEPIEAECTCPGGDSTREHLLHKAAVLRTQEHLDGGLGEAGAYNRGTWLQKAKSKTEQTGPLLMFRPGNKKIWSRVKSSDSRKLCFPLNKTFMF